MAIATVIRLENEMVMVFDKKGEQLTACQGVYQDVRGMLLQNAPSGAVFSYWYEGMTEPFDVSREAW